MRHETRETSIHAHAFTEHAGNKKAVAKGPAEGQSASINQCEAALAGRRVADVATSRHALLVRRIELRGACQRVAGVSGVVCRQA